MTRRREAFIARRKAMGFTQESFAEQTRTEVSTVRGWESGRHTPQPGLRQRIADALELSLTELHDLLDPRPSATGSGTGRITASKPFPLEPSQIEPQHGRIDSAMAGFLQQRVRHLCQQYDHAPSSLLLAEASNLCGQITYLPPAGGDRETQDRLHAAAAEASLLMGQVLWDASERRDHAGALSYLSTAASHADAIGDADTAALARLRSGMVALYGQRQLVAAALMFDRAAQEARSHAIRVFAQLHRAEVHAFSGQRQDCERTLARVETGLDVEDPDDPRADLCSPRTFDRMAGSCHLQLGRVAAAIGHLENAQGPRKKSGAIVLANLATAHAQGGALDLAAAHLHSAIDELDRTRSGGGLRLAAEAARLLSGRGYPRSYELQDRLLGLMASLH
jgi:transcriptional regulator with XRE-family HTH domain